MSNTNVIITKNDANRTILKYLKNAYDLPIGVIEKGLRKGYIQINQVAVKSKNHKLIEGDVLTIKQIDLKEKNLDTTQSTNNKDFKLNVVFENDDILVVNKPTNLVMHGSFHSLDSYVNNYLGPNSSIAFVPSSIGRLDKDASGLVIYGKTYEAVSILKANQKKFEKYYQFKSDLSEGTTVNIKLKHDEFLRKEIVSDEGKEAITIFTVENSLKIAQIITGRKHQIRATLAYLNAPIYGDVKYGGIKSYRMFLHSYKIKICHLTGRLAYLNDLEFESKPT